MRRVPIRILSMLLALGVASPAAALVISGSSSAYGVLADASGLLLDLDSAGPVPEASGAAPGPYDETGDSTGVDLAGNLTTGALDVSASSNVDGADGPRSASAEATVASLFVGNALSSLLTLSATSVSATAEVAGQTALTATGGVLLSDLAISVLGNPLAIPSNPGANTVIFDSLGVTIVLNEQVTSGGPGELSLVVNAIRIAFDDAALGLGLLNGELVFGHAEASLTVPEPGLGLAVVGVALALARRRR